MSTEVRMNAEVRPPWPVGTPRGPRRELLIFFGAGVLTLVIISLGLVLIGTQVAQTVTVSSAQGTATGPTATLLLAQILPLCVGGLVLLQLVQVPIAVRLARRVAQQQAEHADLLERVLSASERERLQLAAHLHDGLIQDLAGAGYALAALAKSVPPERTATAERVGAVVRGAVDSLRHLMVDIYPPDLSGAGLATAVDDLIRPLRDRGVAVSVEVTALPPMDSEAATMLYRVAREALTNIAKHAKASAVQVSLAAEPGPDRDDVLLRVIDNGVGLPTDALDHRAEGHLGLQLLIDRIAGLGGELAVYRADGRGTIIEARVPACSDSDHDHSDDDSGERLDDPDVVSDQS